MPKPQAYYINPPDLIERIREAGERCTVFVSSFIINTGAVYLKVDKEYLIIQLEKMHSEFEILVRELSFSTVGHVTYYPPRHIEFYIN